LVKHTVGDDVAFITTVRDGTLNVRDSGGVVVNVETVSDDRASHENAQKVVWNCLPLLCSIKQAVVP
jgi:hypothetical protein